LITFIALVAAIGVGTIISAIVGHWTAISNHRQAWINALRDDLAEFFKEVETLNYVIGDFLKDSVKVEDKRREVRISVLFAYERIRMRLNRVEERHIELERKLGEFLNEPLNQALADRTKINEAVDLARKVLKCEWETTKYPWKPRWKKIQKLWARKSN
jgi:hypothetical protein